MEALNLTSQRGSKLLLVDNYKFCKAHTSKCGKIRWRCWKRQCTAKIYTRVEEENRVIAKTGEHSHDPDKTIARQAVSNGIKRKAEEDLFEKPSKLIHRELHINPHANQLGTEDVRRIRDNIYNARRRNMPRLPQNAEDVFDIIEQGKLQLQTNRQEHFLVASDRSKNILIFSCYSNLRFLSSVEVFYMDGTFEYCTSYFKQMFTIHGLKNGFYVPLLFAVLPDKEYETYVHLFSLLQLKCSDFGLVLNPLKIVTDFEIAIQKACLSTWNNATLVGCRFHLCQNWFRKIQKLGLCSEYKNKDSVIGRYLRTYFGIQFLTPADAEAYFNTEMYYLMPGDKRVLEFRKYLSRNYFNRNALFPPTLWCSNKDFLFRTTNNCESFHSRFNKHFYHSHPNIFNFTNVLLNFQTETYVMIRSANNSTKTVRKNVREKVDFINCNMRKYEEQLISRYSLVTTLSYKFLP